MFQRKSLDEVLGAELAEIQAKDLYRHIQNYHNHKLIDFASNDYLGLASRTQATSELPCGSTGSRLLTGTHAIHLELEEAIAKWKGTEAAILFGSGYLANIGAISCLANPRDVIFSDELNHACILDGIKLSGAKKFFYRHNDMEHLEELLSKHREQARNAIIISDTVFSMDGDRAKLDTIVKLAKDFGAYTYIDEAHASGVLGSQGAGLAEELADAGKLARQSIELQMGTFSKALGVEGAYIAGSKTLIAYLQNRARSFLFSTAPSPATTQTILANLRFMQANPQLRSKLHTNIQSLRELLSKHTKIKWQNDQTAIFSIAMASNAAAIFASQQLLDSGLLVLPIRYPTVASPRLRVCLSARHSPEEIALLVSKLDLLS